MKKTKHTYGTTGSNPHPPPQKKYAKIEKRLTLYWLLKIDVAVEDDLIDRVLEHLLFVLSQLLC